jgi:hypothetical protein
MTEPGLPDRYRDAIAGEVAALERDIRHHLVDLEEAFGTRDWATVARIYRSVARIADQLEELDPDARSRILARADDVQTRLVDVGPDELDVLSEPLDG